MLRVALTGGIATGKSHVLRHLAARGVPTIDADVLSREVVSPGTAALQAIAARFGSGVLDAGGALNRRALADRVFADAEARRALEGIIHPAVYGAIGDWLARLDAAGRDPVAVADIPLLYETGHEGDFDRVIVTRCDPAQQIARLQARDGLSEAEARARLAAQWPVEEKAARAHYVIDTNGSATDTDRQVDAVLAHLKDELKEERPPGLKKNE
jgi:dephospho-CoA kinase